MPGIPGAADILSIPQSPTYVQNAFGNGAAISYQIVAINFGGQHGMPSPSVSTPANNNATANVTLNWVLVPGQFETAILKNGNLLAIVGPGVQTYTDSAGSSGSAYTQATANPAAYTPSVVSLIEGQKPTYSFSILGLSPASSPTDILNLTGSALKTIHVTRITISALQTTAGNIDVQIIKRSGGTQSAGTAGTAVLNDTNNPPATATVQTYTSNPASLGTSLGVVHADKLFVAAAATAGSPDKLALRFGDGPSQALDLRGATQSVSVNLNAVTLTGGSVDLYIEWEED